MRRSIWERIQEIINKHVIHGKWVRSVIALSCVVIFITTYVLIMPAVTLSGAATCGQEEHTHTGDCYETETELTCDREEHTHSEDCYDEEGNLICGMEEHVHGDGCYTTKEVLVCGKEEHTHTGDCYPQMTTEEAAQEDTSSPAADAFEDEEETMTEEVSGETAATAETVVAEEPFYGDLKAEGKDYTITVTCTQAAKLPADVSLKVKEITKKKEYNAYKSQMEEELIDAETTKVTGARFFDITLLDKDGNELHPEQGVTVLIETKDTLEQDEKVQICHFDEEKDKPVEVESREVVNETYEEENLGVEFEAESFSVYGVVYTVDFEYTDPTTGGTYYFSLDGGSSISLSDLLVVLGIKNEEEADAYVAEQVEDVTFSDPELILVSRDGDDWLLESLEPFNTEETLTVTLKNSNEIIIIVNDLQYTTSLNDVMTDLTISGAEWDAASNSYIVKKGKPYSVSMTFQEGEGNGQYQFSNDSEMTLTLPAGITFETGSTFNIYVNEAGDNFTISGNTVRVVNGNIVVKLNNNDPNYQKLKDLTTATFTISATGVFSNQSSEYIIDGQTDTKIKVDDTPDVNITKSGAVVDWNSSSTTAKVKYRLEVRSNGEATGVQISDVISGTGLTYDQGSAKVYLDGQQVSGWTTTSQSNTGFSMTTGTLQDGKTYVVEYTATINKANLVDNGDGTYSVGANNEVNWTGNKKTTHDLGHVVNKPGISKSGSTKEQNGSETITTWKIEADSDYGDNNRLATVRDRIATDGVEYVGPGIHVSVIDKDTNQEIAQRDISWGNIWSNDHKSWSYDVSQITTNGNEGKKYHYVITYDTKYDIGSATQGMNIKNDFEDNRGNEGQGQAWVNPNPENRYGLEKQFTSKEKTLTGDTIVTWTIKVTIPAAGLSAADAVLTDVLPSTGSYQDTFDSYVNCTGLYSGEGVTVDSTSETGKVLFTFTKGGSAGLNASTDGKARVLTLTLKTKCDPNWMADENAELTHTNEAIFHNEHQTAHYTPDKPSIKKEGKRDGEEGGLPKFSYSVTAGVFSDDLFTDPNHYPGTTIGSDANGRYVVIEDTFDDRLVYIDGSATVGGGDQNSQENGRSSNGVTATANGNKVTFKLYQNSLPKNGTNLYQYYKINYSLKVKDQDTLIALRDEAIAQGKAVELGNSVTGFGGNGTTVNYEPKILDKEHKIKDGKLEFTITVNEEGLKLSDNGVLVLTDSMTNLSVRYQDITVEVEGNKTAETTDADGNPVTAPYFNMKGNDITFYIPDEAKVTITYVATPRGEVGDDGKIHYSNTAKLKGFEKTDSGEKEYESEASGYGTNYAVYIYKADGNVNSNALAGAEFKLYEADELDANGNIISGTPIKTADGKDYVVTTSDGRDGSQKGVVRVMGTEALGWNLKPEKRYYLLETKAPEGYALDNTKYSFIISKDGYVNYTSKPVVAPDGSGKLVQAWTYHNGDVLTMKDYRKDGVLTLEKGFENIDPTKLDDDQKAGIKFEIYTIQEEGGQETQTLWRTITYDQFSAETNEDDGTVSYRYTIGDLPEGKYRVVETIDDVTCRDTTYAIVDPDDGAGVNNGPPDKDDRYATIVISDTDVRDHTENMVTVTNTYDEPSEFKIYKHAEGETSYKLAKAEFGVFEINGSNQIVEPAVATYKTNSRGRFSILQTDEDGQAELQLNKVYALKETKAPEGFLANEQVTYFCFLSDGQTSLPANAPQGTVAIPWKEIVEQKIEDTPDTTHLEAQKVYLNELLVEDKTVSDPVQVIVKQIASYDKEGTVTEPVLSGYYKTDADKPVKSAQQATIFTIIKDEVTGKWHLEDDGEHVVNGQLINLPTMTFDNHIPIYYTYEVEELPVPGYVPSYEYGKTEEGGTSATVTNKPDTNVPTTKVKAKKKWIDIEDNDVTSRMDLDDGVTVDVYRYTGIIISGKIYDGNTAREPSDQFQMSFTCKNQKEVMKFLPGDRIRITLEYESLADFNSGMVPNLRTNHGNNATRVKDEENRSFVFEIDAAGDDGHKDIWFESLPASSNVTMTVENITADEAGRVQVLTQAEAELLKESSEKVESLPLNKQNGWSATSKEYVAATSTEVYSYFIVEPNGSNFEAEYSFSGDGITVTNKDKNIEVQKIWQASNGDDITESQENGSVTFKLYQQAFNAPVETFDVNYSQLKVGHVGWAADAITNVSSSQMQGTLAGIKKGSKVEVIIKITDPSHTWNNTSLNGMTVTGAHTITKGSVATSPDNTVKTLRYELDDVYDTIRLTGCIEAAVNNYQCDYDLEVTVNVLEEPSIDTTTPLGAKVEAGDITVTYDNAVFTPSADFAEAGITAKAGNDVWSAVLNKLPAAGYDEQYGKIVNYKYSVVETVTEEFDLVSVTESAEAGGKLIAVNKLKPGSLRIHKVVAGASVNKTYEIAVTDSNGNYYGADGTNYGSTPHYEIFNAGATKVWNPLTPGMYTVTEKDASEEGYTWTVTGTDSVKVNRGETAESTVTNSYFKNTEYTPKITKALKVGDEDVSPWPAGVSFDFYLNFEPGEGQSKTDVVMANREAVATEQNKTGEFGTIEFKKPGTYVFTIEEVEPAGTQNHKKNGIIYSTDKVTLTVEVDGKLLEPGVLEVKSKTYNPANGQAEEGLITNNMDYPSYAPSVTKVLKDDNGPVPEADWAGKSFTFDLAMSESMSAEQKANVIMPETEKTVNDQSEGHKETFGNIAFKAAGTYDFTITERPSEDTTVRCDTTPKNISVQVDADGDGNLSVTKVTVDGTEVTGETIVGSGVTVENTLIREKEFKFKKVWLDDNTDSAASVDWPQGQVITVDLYGKETGKTDTRIDEYALTNPAPAGAAYTVELKTETINGKTYKSYEFTIPHLDAKYDSFYVIEQELPGYFTVYGALQESALVTGQGRDRAGEGEYIINRVVKVSLPETGGPGTSMIYLLGIALIVLAGGGYILRNRRLLVTRPGSGHGRKGGDPMG